MGKSEKQSDNPQGTVEVAGLDTLTLDPANVRKHDARNMEAIKSSLKTFGVQGVLAVVDADGIVRAGNGRVAAAKALGWTEARVFRSPLRGAQAVAYAIADNRTAELAAWDDDVLAQSLAGLRGDLELFETTGFTESESDFLIDLVASQGESETSGETDGRPQMRKSKTIRLLVTSDNIKCIEDAIAKTGQPSRAEALRVICEAYIG